MKSILLTTTALVAFAGAAAADGHTAITFGGEASAEFNSETGFDTAAEMTASASATLDNGLTASTSFTFETEGYEEVTGDISSGSISLSSDTASLTFGTGIVGAVFTAVGDDYAIGTGDDDVYEDGEIDGVVASVTMGGATVTVSGEVAANAADTEIEGIEVGVTTSAAGWDLGFGMVSDTSEYALTASGTAAGADIGFGMSSDDEWDASIEYPVGAVTVSASTDEAEAWTVGVAYAADGMSAGYELNADETWEITAGYDANGAVLAVAFTDASVMTLGATYDMGNGLTVGAGIEDDENYAFASYDLGGGANAFVDYTDAAAELEEVGPSERDIAVGTTVGVSFAF
nr:porin [Yoonia sp.]